MVVVDHQDGYVSVYAGLGRLVVGPGAFIKQGMPLGNLGAGPLRFEIRRGARPANTLTLLPAI
jgi:septal ring factor EnvC (AmiA/AmiB activator)